MVPAERFADLSITATRNFIEKSGCGLIVGILLAIVMAMGLFYSCDTRRSAPETNNTQSPVIATVGKESITLRQVSDRFQALMEQQGASGGPSQELFWLGQAFDGQLRFAYMLQIAQELGVPLDDESVIAFQAKSIDTIPNIMRGQLEQSGTLKKGASDAELYAAIEKVTGQSWESLRKQQLDKIRQSLEDPAQRYRAVEGYLQQALPDRLAANVQMSDDQLKASFDEFTVKRIYFGPATGSESPQALAEKVYREITAGLKFEDAMQKYSKDTPEPKKKVSDLTQTLLRQYGDTSPYLKPVFELKVGQVSKPIDTGIGPAIYKVINIKRNLPPDFEAKKSEYASQLKTSIATRQFYSRLDEMQKSQPPKIQSPGFALLEEWIKVRGDRDLAADPKRYTARLKELADQAKDQVDPDALGMRAIQLVRYWALDQLWAKASESERKALTEDRIAAILGALETMEDLSLRVDLVELYIRAGKYADAVQSLLTAARSNNGFEAANQQAYMRMADALDRLSKLHKVEEADRAEIRRELERWATEKKQEDERRAEEKRKAAEEAKRAAEEERKAKAAQARERGKSAPPPGPAKEEFLGPSGGTPQAPKTPGK